MKTKINTKLAKHSPVTRRHQHPLADDLIPDIEDETFNIPRDHKALRPVREILVAVESLNSITGAVPGYVYTWQRYIAQNAQAPVDILLLLEIDGPDGREPLWEVVKGKMPEARERMASDGTRRVGDVMLLRTTQDKYDALRRYEQMKVDRQLQSVEQPLHDFAAATGLEIGPLSTNHPSMKRGFARQVANQQFDKMVRTGRVPGARPGFEIRA